MKVPSPLAAQQRGEAAALAAVATMRQGQVADLDTAIAVAAAQLSTAHNISLADSIILANAHAFGANIWTQDAHLQGLASVNFKEKRSS